MDWRADLTPVAFRSTPSYRHRAEYHYGSTEALHMGDKTLSQLLNETGFRTVRFIGAGRLPFL